MFQVVIAYQNKSNHFIAELSKPDYKTNSEILYKHYLNNTDDIVKILYEYFSDEQPVPGGTYCIINIRLVESTNFDKVVSCDSLNFYVHWDCTNLEKICQTKENEKCEDVGDKFGFLYPFGF